VQRYYEGELNQNDAYQRIRRSPQRWLLHSWHSDCLDVVVYDFRDGRSAEAIFEAYPSIGSLAKVYGTITFILEHPKEIEVYLGDQDRRFEEFKAQNPLTPDMIERLERAKRERSLKQS
jgi:hypothetical protein